VIRRGARDRSRGQALVEFALVIPIFLFILFAIVDLGRYVYSLNALNEAARESARTGSVAIRPECTGLTREACIDKVGRSRLATSTIPLSTVTLVSTCEHVNPQGTIVTVALTACRSNDMLLVDIQAPYGAVTPFISGLVGTPTMTGSARVTVHQ
jgi:Flp pilus assembly protein TadG